MLSNLYDKTFTIINQIPTSETVATKIAWRKNVLNGCDKVGRILDQSSGNMVYKANAFTAYIKDWERYLPPTFSGYYGSYQTNNGFTVAVGDLIIFREIEDPAPTSVQEFNALRTKYVNEGGILTGAEADINYKPDGTPWDTNHIEAIKG